MLYLQSLPSFVRMLRSPQGDITFRRQHRLFHLKTFSNNRVTELFETWPRRSQRDRRSKETITYQSPGQPVHPVVDCNPLYVNTMGPEYGLAFIYLVENVDYVVSKAIENFGLNAKWFKSSHGLRNKDIWKVLGFFWRVSEEDAVRLLLLCTCWPFFQTFSYREGEKWKFILPTHYVSCPQWVV